MDGGPHAGQADTGRVVVAYQYTKLPSGGPAGDLEVEGRVVSVPNDTNTVNIYLLSLDAGGAVIARDVLYASGFGNSYAVGNWAFQTAVNIPPGTAAIAFDAYTRRSRGQK
jgi:hypothetical protein